MIDRGVLSRMTSVAALGIGLVSAFLIVSMVAHPASPAAAQNGAHATAVEAYRTFVAEIDAARVEAGLPPYSSHPLLGRLAQAQAEHIVKSGNYSHIGPRGLSARQRILDAGFPGVRAGENFVARNWAREAVRWLMADPPHRANVLHTLYNVQGVGVARTEWGGWVWVQDLGHDPGLEARAPVATPTADAPAAPQASPAASSTSSAQGTATASDPTVPTVGSTPPTVETPSVYTPTATRAAEFTQTALAVQGTDTIPIDTPDVGQIGGGQGEGGEDDRRDDPATRDRPAAFWTLALLGLIVAYIVIARSRDSSTISRKSP